MAGVRPVQITDWTPVGGIFKHIEYKMELNLEGAYWEVYRRYKDFETLEKSIRLLLGEAWCAENGFKPKLPGKELPYQLHHEVITKRIPLLNTFLLELTTFNPPADHKEQVRTTLRTFLDMDNRGKSGVRLSLEGAGASAGAGGKGTSVVREAFVLVARPSSFNLFYQSMFVALTNQKVLYICSNVYDRVDQAKHIIPLDIGGLVVQVVGTKRFDLKCPDGSSYCFQFTSDHDAAHWMRSIGDATTAQVVQRSTETTRRTEQIRQQEEEKRQKQAAYDAAPKEQVNFGKTGATQDQLSMQFGV